VSGQAYGQSSSAESQKRLGSMQLEKTQLLCGLGTPAGVCFLKKDIPHNPVAGASHSGWL